MAERIVKMMSKKGNVRLVYTVLIILSYILAVTLIFWGIYSIMQGEQSLGDKKNIGGGQASIPVLSVTDKGQTLLVGQESIRAVWIATVSNINYPSQRDMSEQQLSSELDNIVENAARLGANTIFFQVRPCSDALYNSSIFPQSHYVSGRRGEAADGGFDSLAYLISAAHSKGISVHAWVNPVRVLSGSKQDPATADELCEDEPAALHPEWTVQYADGKLYFNLGIPEVRTLISDGVYEIVKNYDVDGVVFDDYFYPYPVYDEGGDMAVFDDSDAYAKYGGTMSLDDFRRDCVNTLVRVCKIAVKKANKNCLFGIAPFGIWKNSVSEGGAGTAGLEAYYEIYCDALSFAREGNVDYVAPQLYWGIGDESADFIRLADWWNTALSGTDTVLIPCLAAYRYTEGSYSKGELTAQIEYARKLTGYAGCAVYGYAALTDNSLSVSGELAALWGE